MNTHDPHLHDPSDHDPAYFEEYHQDYQQGIIRPATSTAYILAVIVCLAAFIYHTLFALDYDLLPLPELLWNVLVYATPSRLLDAAETYQDPLRITNPGLEGIPRTHAAKSEAMRRVLGLDRPGGIIESVAQAGRRRLSTLPGLNLSAHGDGRPAGLGNWDNSCYQNSVLQGLASLNSLPGYLKNPIEEPSASADKPEMKMAEALRTLIATLNDPSNNGKRIWTPATLKSMSSWQQQDAQEYFSKVLDEIDKEVRMMAQSAQSSSASGSRVPPGQRSTSPPSLSKFRNPLEGLIAQRVGCTKCGYSEGLSMIPFNCLTVPLTRSWECSVSECLDEYTKLELIEGVECGKCTLLKYRRLLTLLLEKNGSPGAEGATPEEPKRRLALVEEALEDDDYEERTLLKKCGILPKNLVSSTKSRQAVIARPPKSLVVHFNRSMFDEMTGELKKNLSHVKFPLILDLGPWCLGSSGTVEDALTEKWLLDPEKPMIASTRKPSRISGPLYELRAVVTHYGRHENGHYVCYKNFPAIEPDDVGDTDDDQPKGHWWRLSDDEVTRVSEDNVLGQGGVFMLFYDCIKPGATNIPSSDSTEPVRDVSALEKVQVFATAGPEREDVNSPDLAMAAATPLPDTADEGLSPRSDQDSFFATQEIRTSVSDLVDEDEADDQQQTENYQPAQAILVPPYINNSGSNSEQRKEASLPSSGGSLVMV